MPLKPGHKKTPLISRWAAFFIALQR